MNCSYSGHVFLGALEWHGLPGFAPERSPRPCGILLSSGEPVCVVHVDERPLVRKQRLHATRCYHTPSPYSTRALRYYSVFFGSMTLLSASCPRSSATKRSATLSRTDERFEMQNFN